RPKAPALASALWTLASRRGVRLEAFVADAALDLGPGFYLGREGALVLALDGYGGVAAAVHDAMLARAPPPLLRVGLSGLSGAKVEVARPAAPDGACPVCAFGQDHMRSLQREASCTGGARRATVATRTVSGLVAARLGAAMVADALAAPPPAPTFTRVDV